ncbi:hypothetical protein [Fluviispira sanaruensis]|uniref:Uncharacterized protein n=1 Tax=Fluviispira sanaruensis TaxID=2493639 RepID=A0A4P2W0M5_FLUSA|nr:hypothetical protein [Fluviispira sanaruensis]BBH54722.1 hypothetical protein JCM31447_31960 [Fluviispira sanaruensis]
MNNVEKLSVKKQFFLSVKSFIDKMDRFTNNFESYFLEIIERIIYIIIALFISSVFYIYVHCLLNDKILNNKQLEVLLKETPTVIVFLIICLMIVKFFKS